jgi:hypothetical protein
VTFAASTRIRLVETSSGRADSRYPDGNDGSGAIPLEWASIPDTSFLQGVPGSINFLTYLTQPVPNTAAFSLLQNGAVTGVSLGTTSLDYSGTGTGSGIYQVRASRLGVQVDSRAFIVTCTAPASTDITAPTIPTGLTAVASLVGVNPVVTVTFDAFSDPAVTGQTTSGAKQGDVLRNGIQVGTVAVSAGVPLQATNTDIGSPAGAGSVLQSGSSYTVTGGGTGVGSTSDVCAFANVQVTGDFLITATLASVTGTTVNATAGLMVRSALSATERAVMLLVSPTRVRTRTRVTAGTATTPSTPYDGVTWPVTLKMQRIGDVITTYFLQGSAWQLIDTDTVSMGTAVFIGLYATYGASGTPTVDALFTQVNLVTNNVSSLTFTDTVGNGLAFSTAYTYTVRSEDLAGNISAVSPSVNVTTPDNPTPVIPLRLYMDFESGSIAPGDPSGNPPVVTTTEHLTGTRCMMSFLDKNNSANKFRTEIDLAQDNAAGTAPFLKHCWYGFALKLPANYNALISNQGEVQAQWHASEDAGEAALNPVIALYFEDGRYRLGMIGDSRQGAALVKPYETSTFGVVPNSVSFDPILGAWQRFVLHVVWNPQKTPPAGLVQFWRNGVSIVNQPTRQIGFNDIRGPYMKIGMYKSAWKDAAVRAGDPVSTRTIFHDEIRIVYDVVDGYDLVYPA